MKLGRSIYVFLALALKLSPALAQEANTARVMAPGSAPQDLMCRAFDHIDGQLAYIRAELKITTAQDPQWNVFANSFRADKERQAQTCKNAQDQSRQLMSANLPDAMKIKSDRLAQQLESLRRLEASIQTLYDILSKDQKKIADDILKGAP